MQTNDELEIPEVKTKVTKINETKINEEPNQEAETEVSHLDETLYNTIRKEQILKVEKQKDELQQSKVQINKRDNIEIDEDKLRQFLCEEQISVSNIRCIIVGCGNAGKTTLLKRLQNVSYEELKITDRTEMVDVHVNSFEVLVEENTIQSIKEEDKLPAIVFSAHKFTKSDMEINAGYDIRCNVELEDDSSKLSKFFFH